MSTLDPSNLSEQQIYNFMMSSILPRPISWISTISSDGQTNLAPFSYFMGVCSVPMTVMFCPKVGPLDRVKNDTLLNLEQVPEFVVHIVNTGNVEAANLPPAIATNRQTANTVNRSTDTTVNIFF